jgi:hypothetical protein
MSIATPVDRVTRFEQIFVPHISHSIDAGLQSLTKVRDPDLGPDFCIDQEKEMSRLGCVSVAAGVTLNLRCHSYNFQFFLQM